MSHAPAQPLGMLWPLHQGTQAGLGCKDDLISGPPRPQPHRAILQAEVQDGVSFLIAFGYFCCSPDMDRVRNPDPGTLGGAQEGHPTDSHQTKRSPCSSLYSTWCSAALQDGSPPAEQGGHAITQKQNSKKVAKKGSKPAGGTQQQDWGMLQPQSPFWDHPPTLLVRKQPSFPIGYPHKRGTHNSLTPLPQLQQSTGKGAAPCRVAQTFPSTHSLTCP